MDDATLKARLSRVIRLLDNRDMSVSSARWMGYCRVALEYLVDEIDHPSSRETVTAGQCVDEAMERAERIAEMRQRAI